MKIRSLLEFFLKSISITSELLDSEENKLTPKEKLFLAHCCRFNYLGGDLNNFKELSQYFDTVKLFSRKKDVSVYKNVLGTKRWILSGKDKFVLPDALNIVGMPEQLRKKVELIYDPYNGDD